MESQQLQLLLYLAICCLLVCLVIFTARQHRARAALRRAIRSATGVTSYRASLPRLSQEFDRARRYAHPLTLVVLRPQTDSLREPEVAIPQLFAFSMVGPVLRDALRVTDILAFDPTHGEYVLLMPESPKCQSLGAVQRVQDLTWERAGLRLQARMAEFPTDGLTIEDLVGACRTPGDGQPPATISLETTGAAATDERWVAAR